MKILVTGAAGFIGFFVSKSLVEKGHEVVGLDNINDYYDVNLKYARLNELGIARNNAEQFNVLTESTTNATFSFIRLALEDRDNLPKLFNAQNFDVVCNLAAQAGVRYSLENPEAYVDSNLVGFLNILECCRNYRIKHLVYASSSSVYGLNDKVPFKTTDRVDHPVSLYAATKKSNELMAHTYSHLYKFQCTGLRFFTVYGPWGRPDMAYFSFTENILANKPINVYNNGELARDFTYIDDIVDGITLIIRKGFVPNSNSKSSASIYNIGRGKSVKLMDFIKTIETNLNKEAELIMMPMQDGDVFKTWADTDELTKNYSYSPKINLEDGVKMFINWYLKTK
ncbi:NAD-dependent epimerase/dehydratase family protein [Maribacter sp. BPC-D8]|uniref:NAD-dependent epimerase/dehydratase family protein n=1 Tax=Maribacter sp. BPC-D8 TaxID=3053613 RepID=UPI002B45B417|nr:NAD-dependent epimerase/dehydratase family protein [Maribacter sp. BPC-D8]WRI31275.1 NAD-dependent epimerase/dehydratase family protein [Maribacter sp. BPC-D8]